MLFVASIASQFIGGIGAIAAAMAIGIFVGQARPSLAGESDAEVRKAATEGGLWAICIVLLVLVLSSILD